MNQNNPEQEPTVELSLETRVLSSMYQKALSALEAVKTDPKRHIPSNEILGAARRERGVVVRDLTDRVSALQVLAGQITEPGVTEPEYNDWTAVALYQTGHEEAFQRLFNDQAKPGSLVPQLTFLAGIDHKSSEAVLAEVLQNDGVGATKAQREVLLLRRLLDSPQLSNLPAFGPSNRNHFAPDGFTHDLKTATWELVKEVIQTGTFSSYYSNQFIEGVMAQGKLNTEDRRNMLGGYELGVDVAMVRLAIDGEMPAGDFAEKFIGPHAELRALTALAPFKKELIPKLISKLADCREVFTGPLGVDCVVALVRANEFVEAEKVLDRLPQRYQIQAVHRVITERFAQHKGKLELTLVDNVSRSDDSHGEKALRGIGGFLLTPELPDGGLPVFEHVDPLEQDRELAAIDALLEIDTVHGSQVYFSRELDTAKRLALELSGGNRLRYEKLRSIRAQEQRQAEVHGCILPEDLPKYDDWLMRVTKGDLMSWWFGVDVTLRNVE